MIVALEPQRSGKPNRRFWRIARNLYRRVDPAKGTIYARVRVEGDEVWRSTETDDPKTARDVLAEWRRQQVLRRNGIEPPVAALERKRYSVNQAIDAYVAAGFPDRRMRPKRESTVETETKCLVRLRPFFGARAAVSLSPKDCDDYREWRASGGYTWEHGKKDPKTRQSCAGTRVVDIELQTLANALRLAVRQQKIRFNPLAQRTRYHSDDETRHCREVAPTPQQLEVLEHAIRGAGRIAQADCILFLALSGVRIGEALPLEREVAVDWSQELVHVRRQKRGINPWVPMTDELRTLLRQMQARAAGHLLFPSPRDPTRPIAYSTVAHTLTVACRELGLPHVSSHGLRSYYVTQCRESGLSDAEIAALIGDRTGPAIIATTYGDVRSAHLIAQAKRLRLLVAKKKD